MNAYNMLLTKNQKAIIHIAKAELGLDDAEYAGILERFGVESSKQLKQRQFPALMEMFRANGFKGYQSNTRRAKTIRKHKKRFAETGHGWEEMNQKIGAILADLRLDWDYVDSIAKSRFGVERVSFLKKDKTKMKQLMQMMIMYKERITARAYAVGILCCFRFMNGSLQLHPVSILIRAYARAAFYRARKDQIRRVVAYVERVSETHIEHMGWLHMENTLNAIEPNYEA